jgi:hypothetical protein
MRDIIVRTHRASRRRISIGTDYTQNLTLAAVGYRRSAFSHLEAEGYEPIADNDS